MTEVLTAAQMGAIEQAAIRSGTVTGLDLMERAGRGVVEAIFAHWPEMARAPHNAVVVCGPGNNGGDGFVVARLLRQWGWAVEVYLYGDADKLPADARANYQRWREMGAVGALDDAPRHAGEAALFVDALFGTGLGRPLEGAAREWAADRQSDAEAGARTVAVDMPSGLCSDSGRYLGTDALSVHAGLTVSFHAPKLGHYLASGPEICGHVVVSDIGLEVGAEAGAEAGTVRLVMHPAADSLGKRPQTHKYDHGHALVMAGGFGRTGAARLAAQAALRIGAGLVTLGAPGAAQIEVASQITALMLRRIEDGAALQAALDDRRITALCLGPGLGLPRARDLVPAALEAHAARAVLLDADALTAFAEHPEALFTLLHPRCLLTPHAGEFARLFPDLAEKLAQDAPSGPAYSRVDAVRAAARRAGCAVLLKGADTVIADPAGRCSLNAAVAERAAPWLATAGSGDVLAGFITGLMARGLTPLQAAEAGAWLHVECARSFGPGLTAADLPEALPEVFRQLLH